MITSSNDCKLIEDQPSENKQKYIICDINNIKDRKCGLYEEEIYYRCISQGHGEVVTNEDSDDCLQNRIIMNNFVTNEEKVNLRPRNFSFDQQQEKETEAQILQGCRRSPYFPNIF